VPAARPERRSQQERAASTRAAVLDATIACLVEHGYAATSTTLIQERTATSRGALTHHFPSKHALFVAAIEHLASAREREILDAVDTLPTEADRAEEALRLVWSSFCSDLFLAAVELWTASRTDDDLHAPLYAAERRLGQRHHHLLAEVFGPAIADHPRFTRAVTLVIEQMRGTALTDILRRSRTDDRLVVEASLVLLHSYLGGDVGAAGARPR
jgi:AcrR family transcriptional regulator